MTHAFLPNPALTTKPGPYYNHFIIYIMVAIINKLMTKIVFTNTNIFLAKFSVDRGYTTEIIILMSMYKMYMDNLNLML